MNRSEMATIGSECASGQNAAGLLHQYWQAATSYARWPLPVRTGLRASGLENGLVVRC